MLHTCSSDYATESEFDLFLSEYDSFECEEFDSFESENLQLSENVDKNVSEKYIQEY